MRIYLKDLSEAKRKEIEDMMKEVGLDTNQVTLQKDGEKIIAEIVRTGERYTLLLGE